MSRSVEDPQSGVRTSRRRFVTLLGATAAVAPIARLLPAAAQTSAPAPAPPAPPVPPASTPPGSDATDPEIAAEAQHITDVIQRRFGARLDAAQLESVREDVQSTLEAGRALRKVELRNADEPDIVFRARPLEG